MNSLLGGVWYTTPSRLCSVRFWPSQAPPSPSSQGQAHPPDTPHAHFREPNLGSCLFHPIFCAWLNPEWFDSSWYVQCLVGTWSEAVYGSQPLWSEFCPHRCSWTGFQICSASFWLNNFLVLGPQSLGTTFCGFNSMAHSDHLLTMPSICTHLPLV